MKNDVETSTDSLLTANANATGPSDRTLRDVLLRYRIIERERERERERESSASGKKKDFLFNGSLLGDSPIDIEVLIV